MLVFKILRTDERKEKSTIFSLSTHTFELNSLTEKGYKIQSTKVIPRLPVSRAGSRTSPFQARRVAPLNHRKYFLRKRLSSLMPVR